VIATLGRFDELQKGGQLERLLRSGARFSAKAMVAPAARRWVEDHRPDLRQMILAV
jgi:hypothetical protein